MATGIDQPRLFGVDADDGQEVRRGRTNACPGANHAGLLQRWAQVDGRLTQCLDRRRDHSEIEACPFDCGPHDSLRLSWDEVDGVRHDRMTNLGRIEREHLSLERRDWKR